MEEFRLELGSPSGVYFPGQTVSGNVVIKLKETIKTRSVVVSISGKAKTHWTVWERYSANQNTHSEAVPYWAEIVYVDMQCCVWNANLGNSTTLSAGEHRFPFAFLLPPIAPPTFEGTIGFIRYCLKAKIDRPWHLDNVTRCGFTVTPHFDLNSVTYAAFPSVRSVSKELGALFFKSGRINVKLSKSGFVPGESILLHLDIENGSKRDINRIETSLVQNAVYTANRHANRLHYGGNFTRHRDIESKQESRVVVQYVEEFQLAHLSTGTYRRLFAVPPVVPSFNICSIVQVSYLLKVKIVAKGSLGKNGVSAEMPLLIGTVPVRNVVPTVEPSSRDFLVPPQPSAPSAIDESQISFADCLFGKGTLTEDPEEKMPDYTPKYIFYNNVPY